MTETQTLRLRDIPDRHLRAIGLVAVQWSALETTIFRIIALCCVAQVDECRTFLAHMNFPQKCDVMATVIGLACPDSPEHAEILRFVDHLKRVVAPKRNGVIHQDLRSDDIDADLISGSAFKARGTLVETPVQFRESDILAIADEVGRETHALIEIWKRAYVSIRMHIRRSVKDLAETIA